MNKENTEEIITIKKLLNTEIEYLDHKKIPWTSDSYKVRTSGEDRNYVFTMLVKRFANVLQTNSRADEISRITCKCDGFIVVFEKR